MTNLALITFLMVSAAQPGDRYTEYYYPIVTNRSVTNQFTGGVTTNVVTNFAGGWSNPSRRMAMMWPARAGSNYVVETSVSLETRPRPAGTTNEGWTGDGWRPCSLVITGRNGTVGWTSGVPHEVGFFRVRSF
jgi:hypothetical protein